MKIVVFGTEKNAQLANYYLENDSEHEVVAFTVHERLCNAEEYCGKPVIPFEDITNSYPPKEYKLFAPLSGKGLNKIRESVYIEGKEKGYGFISYISSKATVLTNHIGENCFILEDNTIQPFVKIGNNCVLWSGNHIGHHSVVHDHVFFTSHIVISGQCEIESYSWFGVNSTIRDKLKIAEGSLIGMASCITRNTAPYTIYLGVPGKPSGSSLEEKVKDSL